MKKIKFLGLVALTAVSALFVTACQEQSSDNAIPETLGQMVLTASVEQPSATKAILDGKTALWESNEAIKVFNGTGSVKFIGGNVEPSATTKFVSTEQIARSEDGYLWAIYPYSDDASFDSAKGEFSAFVPADQIARAGSFAKGANISVARTKGTDLQFYNLLDGVRFTVSTSSVNKVIFEGLGGENIAGNAVFAFDEVSGKPYLKSVTSGRQYISITLPEGECFTPGEWYYIMALPAALKDGDLYIPVGSDYSNWTDNALWGLVKYYNWTVHEVAAN